MRALTAAAISVAGGAALGVASGFVAEDTAPRVTAALFAAFGVAAALAPMFDCGHEHPVERLRRAGAVALVSLAGAWTAAAVAGDPGAVAAAAVVAAGATLAAAAAVLLRALGVGGAWPSFGGSLVPAATAALVFVADPFVEWNAGEGSLSRAGSVIDASPLASIAAGTGIDWQRSRWLYDGPAPGTAGLSVIGQFYPSRPAPPLSWAALAAVAGFAAVALARPRSSMSA